MLQRELETLYWITAIESGVILLPRMSVHMLCLPPWSGDLFKRDVRLHPKRVADIACQSRPIQRVEMQVVYAAFNQLGAKFGAQRD